MEKYFSPKKKARWHIMSEFSDKVYHKLIFQKLFDVRIKGNILTQPNIRGGGHNVTPLLGKHQYLPDDDRFGFADRFFYISYRHIWRIVAKFQGFIITTFEPMTVFEGRCSQYDNFTIKILFKWQILEIPVKCEQLKIYTWNFVRILVFIRVFCL